MTKKQNESSVVKLVPEAYAPPIERSCFRVYDSALKTQDGKNLRPGVYFHGVRQSKNGAPTEYDQWICSPLHVEAVTSYQDAHFGRLLRFKNSLGRWREWAMPMSMLKGSGEELRGELLHLGVEIDPDAARALSRYILQHKPKRQVTASISTGWYDDRLFIMPRENIGEGDAILQSESANVDDYGKSGTLDGWRDEVSAHCAGNPLLMLGVCTALAGPLLQPTGQQSGGFNIFGRSSTGKSSIAQAAASVWGHGENMLRTWNATGNGLEGIATQRNDTLLVMDELGEADPFKVGEIVYAISNGTGKSRGSRSGGARSINRWRVMIISNGELTLAAKIAEGNKRIKAGQEVRLIDISASRQHGCWDDLSGQHDGAALSKLIKHGSVTHYGLAGPAFVKSLLEDDAMDGLPEAFSMLRASFTPRNAIEGRAADRFALLALAGEIAREAGLIEMPVMTAQDAMLSLFADWQQQRSAENSEDAAIKNQLLDYITRHGEAYFSEIHMHTETIRDRAGWWKNQGAERLWLFTSDGLRRAVPGFDQKTVLDVLEAAGWIAEKEGAKRAKQVKVDGRNVRLYHILPAED